MSKMIAKINKMADGRNYLMLMIDNKIIPNQHNILVEHGSTKPTSITVTFEGEFDENGVMQICEV